MKKLVLLILGLGIILSTPSCLAGYVSVGGSFGGGYSRGFGGGYHGYGGYGGYGMRPPHHNFHHNYNRPQYYYRPTVVPVTTTVVNNINKNPVRPVSCLGTNSYITIGNQVIPCESAAATRIKVSNKNVHKKNLSKSKSKVSKNLKDKDV